MKMNALLKIVLWLVVSYIFFTYIVPLFSIPLTGVSVPIPVKFIIMFMLIIAGGLLLHYTTDEGSVGEIKGTLVKFMTEGKYFVSLIIAVVAISVFVAWVYKPGKIEPPSFARTVHPASKNMITFYPKGDRSKGKKIDLLKVTSPFHEYKKSDPEKYKEHVAVGKKVYYQNCVFCHGDNLDGKGIYTHALNPVPANFQDGGVIPMLTESFLFWRIAKGGPDLPDESGPWSSSMPAWENFLTEDDIWNVILFLSDFTGRSPREKGSH